MSKKTRKKSGTSTFPKSKRKPVIKSKSKTTKKTPKKASKKAPKVSDRTTKTTATRRALPKPAAAASSSNVALLAQGDTAPSFVLPRDGGQTVSLASFAGRKLVIFFYPRADTPGCTREAMDFSRLYNAFAASKTAVLGVSADSLKAQESFRDKYKLSVPLISDEERKILNAYGVWGEKSMYGKMFMGILRTTVLIDRRAKIARIWRNVKVDGHADEVLAATRAL